MNGYLMAHNGRWPGKFRYQELAEKTWFASIAFMFVFVLRPHTDWQWARDSFLTALASWCVVTVAMRAALWVAADLATDDGPGY